MADVMLTIHGLGNSQLEDQDELCQAIEKALKAKYPDTATEVEIDDIEYDDEDES